MAIEVKTKKWGNSIGMIIPNKIVSQLNLKPEQKIIIEIEAKKENVLKEMFGKMKSKKSASQIVNEFRKDFNISKWM